MPNPTARTLQPTSDTVTFTLKRMPKHNHGKLKLLCYAREISLEDGIYEAIAEFVTNHHQEINDLLNAYGEVPIDNEPTE